LHASAPGAPTGDAKQLPYSASALIRKKTDVLAVHSYLLYKGVLFP